LLKSRCCRLESESRHSVYDAVLAIRFPDASGPYVTQGSRAPLASPGLRPQSVAAWLLHRWFRVW